MNPSPADLLAMLSIVVMIYLTYVARGVKHVIGLVLYFSYPYGGINQFTEQNRQRVRDLGFKTCTFCLWRSRATPN